MSDLDRRQFLKVSAMSAAAVVVPPMASTAQAADVAASTTIKPLAAAEVHGVTHTLASYIVKARYEDLPANVRKEGTRTLLNWVGVAVGGSHHETIERAVAALGPFSGPRQAGLFGRRERFDIMNAAFINGVSSHIFDYDDTHLKTIIHPGGPVISALIALSEYRPITGKDFLNALILGVETECRIGNSVYPNHYDVGWHITGTAGVFGAAAAVGKILGLNEQQMVWALGLAASQPVGLRESFGSMNKSFNPGRAASNGLFAALLAEKNFTSSEGMIEAKRGWANTISTKQDYREITEGLGTRYESALNTYKPFACGIVIHPAIDAAIQLRNEYHLTAEQVAGIEIRVHPLVIELTGKKTPQIGLEGKFSVFHSVAAALIDGAAGEKQYSDAAVRNPKIIALRDKVNAIIDPKIKPEQVDMTITTTDGRKLHRFIEHAIGSVEVPMTDAQLEVKFADLIDGILPKAQSKRLMDLCWKIEQLPLAGVIAKNAVAMG
ncbi:MmgE/PrpD family protein [Herbaspirillum sp. RTI4]|uniref:MmgE/PrpD family protein n=1 Tax=Herbaspirillum sp. RTI4 TaxID=3048640 RepID=UPI002AB3F100|nr:MmgE/PrpD family protein [Herbaspirillum sp. RTI4]MDY7579543.1 MmgE/PrpD family protein [Herbaspirillum sp. RTI4]MEA9981828.1 MmgE/PrpD family protein [Herbaspirillum sp. RTI4]